MNKKIKFICEFEDSSPTQLSYEVTGPPLEQAVTKMEGQVPVLYVNKGACKVLAEIFAKLAMSSYPKGFHVHLGKNCDPETDEILRVVLGFD